ncbi:Glycoside hydrolase family 5 protein [Mycena sanguinolenta]|uniref:mannan endo-1,4-beta-mannosidase n=1 Tax=Mycena sanguinolenta TaxID=230812 RepID=A0A8H7DKB3_9AGAR|nr:Glycoside hydrolase family 5 protein [Mycena sanguinolenta]
MRRHVLLLAILVGPALASVPEWGQCGGLGWTGETDCAAGLVCIEQNEYYSQCLAGTTTTIITTPTTVSITSTVKSTTTVSTTSTVKSTTTSSAPTATGSSRLGGLIPSTSSSHKVDVKYLHLRSNAYWPALLGYSDAAIDQAFSDIAGSGATVCRLTIPADYLISSAKSHGIKLLITLTNNWSDFGGMDVYTVQLLGSGLPHDTFYTNPTVVAAYKAYVQAIVMRYLTEDTIMAWELANEPRCAGTSTAASATCNSTVITNWAAEISAYIKSLDPNHLVAIGDEGFINDPLPHDYDYPYQGGGIGIDFEANLAIDTLDFGTFHMYPDSWGESGNDIAWGQQWITDHATIMTSANKPAIMEEFGLTYTGTQRADDYATWYDTVISTGLTGDLLWQAGSVFNGTETPNDGYAIYPTDPVYTLLQQHAAALKARG